MADRRQVLQAGVLAAVTLSGLPGCATTSDEPDAAPTPDQQQSDEIMLIALYDEAIGSSGPAAATVYERIRDEHAAHLRALGWDEAPPPTPAASAPPRRNVLVRAERRASRSRTTAARETADTELAQILALIAASEAQHVVDLEGL